MKKDFRSTSTKSSKSSSSHRGPYNRSKDSIRYNIYDIYEEEL